MKTKINVISAATLPANDLKGGELFVLNTTNSALLMRCDVPQAVSSRPDHIFYVSLATGSVTYLHFTQVVFRARITGVSKNGEVEYEAII